MAQKMGRGGEGTLVYGKRERRNMEAWKEEVKAHCHMGRGRRVTLMHEKRKYVTPCKEKKKLRRRKDCTLLYWKDRVGTLLHVKKKRRYTAAWEEEKRHTAA